MTALGRKNPDQIDPQFLPLSTRDRCDIITTLVTPLVLMASVGLVIYYAICPISPMIPITADFSLSLPIMVCGSTGLLFTAILLIQMCRYRSIAYAFKRIEYKMARSLIHQGGRPPEQTPAEYKDRKIKGIEFAQEKVGPLVSFETRDEVTLSGYWHKAPNCTQQPTVILFHGTGSSAISLSHWGYYYKFLNYNVLMVEYRGYGLSEGMAAGPNQEMAAYLDAEAALKFVLSNDIPRSNVIAHGISLGGTYAAALGYFYGVEHIILDHTFTTIGSICNEWFPFASWDQRISSSYIKSKKEKDPDIPNSRDLETDGFNTLQKVKNMNAEILVICGEKDLMMPMRFTEEFLQARYPDDAKKREASVITLKGEHQYDIKKTFYQNEDQDQEAVKTLGQFLRNVHIKCMLLQLKPLTENLQRLLDSLKDDEKNLLET